MGYKTLWAGAAIGFMSFLGLADSALADVAVRGYCRRDNVCVRPHHRSNPNGSSVDNWSTRGNINPYTGQIGNLKPRSINPASVRVRVSCRSNGVCVRSRQRSAPSNNHSNSRAR